MEANCTWKGKLNFEAKLGSFTVAMDTKSPLGSDQAPSPKQLLLASICGCSAMDVVSLLKKWKEPLEGLDIQADAPTTTGQPSVFSKVTLKFQISGNVAAEKALESVRLSMTKYCGVSAMVFRTSPINYEVFVNGQSIGGGNANFELNQ